MRKRDLLQRDEYIGLLEKIIEDKIQHHEGFSLAIDGKWGCGKTFIVDKLESKLKSRNYMVLHYNCWENDFYDEPLVAIVHSIIDAINSRPIESIPEPRRVDWKKTGKIAAKFLGKIGSMVLKNKLGVDLNGLKFDVDIEKVIFASAEAIEADKEEALNANFDSQQPLKMAILQIRKVLLLLKLEFGSVVFVVDELDRCLPKYAIKVLERLHHINYNVETDRNVFIQVIALNKDEMLGSIASTFGRSFDYKMKIDYNSNNNQSYPSTATVKSEHFLEKQRLFADYYFQKFFQMVIPVPMGKMDDQELSILNGFEINFYKEGVVTKAYIAKFLSEVLVDIPIRIKQEYLQFVKTVHQITALDESVTKDISLGVLGVELTDCLFRYVFKIPAPTLSVFKRDECTFSYKFQKSVELEYAVNGTVISKAFIEWGLSRFGYLHAMYSADLKDHFVNEMNDAASYIKAFYGGKDQSEFFVNRNPIDKEDDDFVKAFRKNLDVIMPLN